MKRLPRIVFRTSAGRQIGFGHLRRCLSLATELRRLGADSFFLLDGDAEVQEQVAAAGFDVALTRPADDPAETLRQLSNRQAAAVVVDSYELGVRYFRSLAEAGLPVVAIDDLGSRELPVSLVVNGSAGAERTRYRCSGETEYLLGPRYMLLRREFAEEPLRGLGGDVRRVLVSVGGSDPHRLSARLASWSRQALPAVAVDVVVGPLFESGLDPTCGDFTVHSCPKDIRSLMLACDLALCAGGQTTYELAATGTPAVAVRVAENQTGNLRGLSEAGTLTWAGDVGDEDLEERVKAALFELVGDAELRASQSWRGRRLVDGLGTARVAAAVMDLVKGCKS